MKVVGFIFLLGISVGLHAQKSDTVHINTSAVCEMCKETLEYQMALERGVKWSSLDLESKVLRVAFNPKKTDALTIKKRVTLTGYQADDLPSDKEAYNKLPECCTLEFHEQLPSKQKKLLEK